MKYIRTKDGVIGCFTSKHEYLLEDENYLKENAIIKQADTIEELCDVKVAIRKSNQKPYLGHFSGPNFFQEDNGWLGRVDSYEIIYGAIWTDKGLIYKAKMKGILPNGEIDWELL